MRCLGCQHDAGYSKPQLVWGGILLSACPFWIRFCQLNFCLNFSNSFSINFQEKFLLTLLFGPSFFINFQDNFAPTLLFGTPVKYIWNSRHPGRSKVQKSRKSSGDNCQKILTNWLYPPPGHNRICSFVHKNLIFLIQNAWSNCQFKHFLKLLF